MSVPTSRLADFIDRFHIGVIIFWLGGFLVPLGTHPHFRLFHALFVIVGAVHQVPLKDRCILTIWSDRIRARDPAWVKDTGPGFIERMTLKLFGFRFPRRLNTIITWLTAALSVRTVIHLLA